MGEMIQEKEESRSEAVSVDLAAELDPAESEQVDGD